MKRGVGETVMEDGKVENVSVYAREGDSADAGAWRDCLIW